MPEKQLRKVTRRAVLATLVVSVPRPARANPGYVIAEPCIGTKDSACVDACPVDCIHPKKNESNFKQEKMLYIDPVECIDCGACVPVCPVSAIFALDDLPKKWAGFKDVNANYYKRHRKPPAKQPGKDGKQQQ